MNRRPIFTHAALLLPALLLSAATLVAQSPRERSNALIERAVRLMDSGSIDASRSLLTEARSIDPTNPFARYEYGYTYILQNDYAKALEYIRPLIDEPEATDRFFQETGNLLDMTGDSTGALKIYRKGLERFPTSGKLYLEIGNMALVRRNYDSAIANYETGITVDPNYPSNYYRAAQLFAGSQEPIWGAIYGEAFMNLEPATDRTRAMSQMLYELYRDAISIGSKDSVHVAFSKRANMITPDQLMDVLKGENTTRKGSDGLPAFTFEGAYETTASIATVARLDGDHPACAEGQPSYECLCAMRRSFTELWFSGGYGERYPNAVFERQKMLAADGLEDLYNHWLLRRGDPDAFAAWMKDHDDDLDRFAKWFGDHPFVIDPKQPIVRAAYFGAHAGSK
jgi:tetratricopeptide (TPR) repeat protein